MSSVKKDVRLATLHYWSDGNNIQLHQSEHVLLGSNVRTYWLDINSESEFSVAVL